LRKIFNRLSRAHERYRQTEDRQTDSQSDHRQYNYSERKREFTFAKNHAKKQPPRINRFSAYLSHAVIMYVSIIVYDNVYTLTSSVSNLTDKKSSAVAEMGDRFATIDTDQKVGGVVPALGGGAGSPSNTMSPGSRPTSVPSDILIHQPFGHNRHGPKIGGCVPLGRAGSPSNTMWPTERQ